MSEHYAIDVAHLERQRDFSLRTFGPDWRTVDSTKAIEHVRN